MGNTDSLGGDEVVLQGPSRTNFRQGSVVQNCIKNPARCKANVIQALEQEFRISPVELDIVLCGGSCFESDGLADDERDRLSFGFADGPGGLGPPRLVVQDLVCKFVRQYSGMLGGVEVREQGNLSTFGNAACRKNRCGIFKLDAERGGEYG